MKKTLTLVGAVAAVSLTLACSAEDDPVYSGPGGTTGGGTGVATGGGTGVATGGGTGTGTGGDTAGGTGGGTTGGGTVSKFVTGGLGVAGDWSGYLFTAAEAGSTITPEAFDGAEICASGSLGASYAEWALVGWNISQPVNEDFSGGTPVAIAPGGTGVAYELVNNAPSGLRIQIQTDDTGTESWCAEVDGAKAGGALTGTIPWADFKQKCWCASAVQADCEGYPYPAYDGTTPLMQVAVQTYAASDMSTTPFNYCVVNLGPAM